MIRNKFILFLCSGGIAFGLNFISRIVLNMYFSFSTSIILAYIIGMITAYILFKNIVFNKNTNKEDMDLLEINNNYKSVPVFMFTNLIAVCQTWVISLFLARYLLPVLSVKLYINEIAHFVGLTVPLFTSYYMHKNWTFR